MTFDERQNDAFRKVNSSEKQRYLDVRMTFDGRQNDAFKKSKLIRKNNVI